MNEREKSVFIHSNWNYLISHLFLFHCVAYSCDTKIKKISTILVLFLFLFKTNLWNDRLNLFIMCKSSWFTRQQRTKITKIVNVLNETNLILSLITTLEIIERIKEFFRFNLFQKIKCKKALTKIIKIKIYSANTSDWYDHVK